MEGNDSKSVAEQAQVCLDLFTEILEGTGNLLSSESSQKLSHSLDDFKRWIHDNDNKALETGSSSLESRRVAAPSLIKGAKQLLSDLEDSLSLIIDPDHSREADPGKADPGKADQGEADSAEADPGEEDSGYDEDEVPSSLLEAVSITTTNLFETSTLNCTWPKRNL
ncbi:MAG: hypothetical protein Q9162_005005 [Coniocarpon cinnabarinum]